MLKALRLFAVLQAIDFEWHNKIGKRRDDLR